MAFAIVPEILSRADAREEVVVSAASIHPIGHEGGRRSLYVTSGAMFLGLAGVFLFAAAGGVLGALAGALLGAGIDRWRWGSQS